MRIDQSLPVLVVDDYTTMTRIIRTILKQLGFANVERVHDGNQALAKLRDGSYSMVISDWNMAPMSGYDLLKEVRSDEKLANIVFIMISVESSIPRVVAARKAQADSYVTKPFSAQTLKAKIEEACANSAAIRGSGHQAA